MTEPRGPGGDPRVTHAGTTQGELTELALVVVGAPDPARAWTALVEGLRARPTLATVSPTDGDGVVFGEGDATVRVRVASSVPADSAEQLTRLLDGVWARRVAYEGELATARAAVAATLALEAELALADAWRSTALGALEGVRRTVGHDLRSPLTVMDGQLQLAESGPGAPGAVTGLIAGIRKQIRRLDGLLEERYAATTRVVEAAFAGDTSPDGLVGASGGARVVLADATWQADPVLARATRLVIAALAEAGGRDSTLTVDGSVEGDRIRVRIARSPSGGERLPVPLELVWAARLLARVGGALTTDPGLGTVSLLLAPRTAGSGVWVSTRSTVRFDLLRAQLAARVGPIRRADGGPGAGIIDVWSEADFERARAILRSGGPAAVVMGPALEAALIANPSAPPLRWQADPDLEGALRSVSGEPPLADSPASPTGWLARRDLRGALAHAHELSRAVASELPLVVLAVSDWASLARALGPRCVGELADWIEGQLDLWLPARGSRGRWVDGTWLATCPGWSLARAEAFVKECEALFARHRPRFGLGRVHIRLVSAVSDLGRLERLENVTLPGGVPGWAAAEVEDAA